MIDLAYAARSIFGAWRLVRFDRTGLALLDGSRIGAIRSFWAAVLLLPPFAILKLIHYWPILGDYPPLPWLTLEALFYVIKWVAPAVVLHLIAEVLDRRHRFHLALAAYNWSSVIQTAILLVVVVAGAIGLLPAALVPTLILIVLVGLLIYIGFVLRVSLDISVPIASLLVAMDLAFSVTLNHLLTQTVFQ